MYLCLVGLTASCWQPHRQKSPRPVDETWPDRQECEAGRRSSALANRQRALRLDAASTRTATQDGGCRAARGRNKNPSPPHGKLGCRQSDLEVEIQGYS